VPPHRGTLRYFVRRCYSEGQGKAELAALLGRDEGLRDERRHASRTLPQGICRELRQAVLGREVGAAQRASAICVGLTAAGLGYLVRRGRPPGPAAGPGGRRRVRGSGPMTAARDERNFGKGPS
jgi:hypothetical protein